MLFLLMSSKHALHLCPSSAQDLACRVRQEPAAPKTKSIQSPVSLTEQMGSGKTRGGHSRAGDEQSPQMQPGWCPTILRERGVPGWPCSPSLATGEDTGPENNKRKNGLKPMIFLKVHFYFLPYHPQDLGDALDPQALPHTARNTFFPHFPCK